MNKCVCPGDILTYNCTVLGDKYGATIWNGTAFSGCPQNDILLYHDHFRAAGGSRGMCNNGDIVGQSLGIQDNNYASQLSVTITPNIVGKTITCAYDALTTDHTNDMIKFSRMVPGNYHAFLLAH